jgi:hypothetical protein
MMKQKLLGRKRYPLVLMLEPLFRCNLACVGCGKIDYPDAILNRRMSAQECWDAADECGAPMVAIPGGEPLIHKEIGEIVRGLVARKKFVSLCTNALLLEKKLDLFEPSPYLFFSVHLDGLKDHHDKAVSQKGVFDRAVSAIRPPRRRLYRQRQRHDLRRPCAEDIAKFLDFTTELGVGVSMSPGYAHERAPTRNISSTAPRPRSCSATCSRSARARSGISCIPACSSISSRAIRNMNAPVGHAGAQHFRLAEALLFARRRLHQDLQGVDGDHRLGYLRHRQIREVRRLHGALRPRADRGQCAPANPLKAMWVALRGPTRGDGARDQPR